MGSRVRIQHRLHRLAQREPMPHPHRHPLLTADRPSRETHPATRTGPARKFRSPPHKARSRSGEIGSGANYRRPEDSCGARGTPISGQDSSAARRLVTCCRAGTHRSWRKIGGLAFTPWFARGPDLKRIRLPEGTRPDHAGPQRAAPHLLQFQRVYRGDRQCVSSAAVIPFAPNSRRPLCPYPGAMRREHARGSNLPATPGAAPRTDRQPKPPQAFPARLDRRIDTSSGRRYRPNCHRRSEQRRPGSRPPSPNRTEAPARAVRQH